MLADQTELQSGKMMSGLKKYAKNFFFHGNSFLIHFIRFEMHMDRPDKSENIFGTSY